MGGPHTDGEEDSESTPEREGEAETTCDEEPAMPYPVPLHH